MALVLRLADQAALAERDLTFSTILDPDGFIAVTVESVKLSAGLAPSTSTMLIRLPPGFPDAGPDMFYFDPPVRLDNGGVVPGTEVTWTDPRGRVWQRWSRHIGRQWRPGIDNLATYLAYIRRCLDVGSGRAA